MPKVNVEFSQNYFVLFGIDPSPMIDTNTLKKTFLSLQKRFHPDKFTNQSEQDRMMAIQVISLVNDAYQVLKNPISRAEYLLNLHHNQKSDNEKHTISDNEFLMLQMELHEQSEAISNSQQKIEFTKKITKNLTKLLNEFNKIYQNDFDTAKMTVQKMQFFNRLSDETNAKDF